jgi:hypothetical protein
MSRETNFRLLEQKKVMLSAGKWMEQNIVLNEVSHVEDVRSQMLSSYVESTS